LKGLDKFFTGTIIKIEVENLINLRNNMRDTKTFKRTKQEKRLALKKIAIQLYNEGFTTREIGARLGRSHAWVALVVKEFKKAMSGLKVDKKT